jgi:hypothetical protein
MFVTFFIVKSQNEIWLLIFIWYFKKKLKLDKAIPLVFTHFVDVNDFCFCDLVQLFNNFLKESFESVDQLIS